MRLITKIMNLQIKKGYKLQFCKNTFENILFKANYFDSGNLSFWHEIDRGVYLKPLVKRNSNIIIFKN